MLSPFQFGKVVSGKHFTNRKNEITKLLNNFNYRINTILISPRRWGKSSLVHAAVNQAEKSMQNTKFCFLDLFTCRDESEFYEYYVREILKATSTKAEEIVKSFKTFFGKLSPQITLGTGADPLQEFNISFDFKEIEQNINSILDLPEKIAVRKKINIVICIDEFQNLGVFKDPISFQKKLRSAWQKHKNVTYCLYGSKKSFMIDIFQHASMPFYKFGEYFNLEKISSQELSDFVIAGFQSTKKIISTELAFELVEMMQCHPYYVQQLAHLVWVNTTSNANKKILETAIDEMLGQNSLLYKKNIESLTMMQVNFLKAVVDGTSQEFSSTAVIQKYKLGTSGNVSKIKQALEKYEILEFVDEKPVFLDPAFELWFKRYMKGN